MNYSNNIGIFLGHTMESGRGSKKISTVLLWGFVPVGEGRSRKRVYKGDCTANTVHTCV
jgi:hypothetical protein